MVVIDHEGDVVKEVEGLGTSSDRKDWTDILMSFVSEAPVIMALKSKRSQESSTVSVVKIQSSPQRDLVGLSKLLFGHDDIFCHAYLQVYQSDLERAVKYSIMTEVAAQSYLSHAKFKALVDFVETLVNFFPNKTENLTNFLSSLLEWLRSNRYHSLSQNIYKAKVEELSDLHTPWGPASDTWASGGCAGSSPEKRGYPCALWTLFHSLMASAYDKVSSQGRPIITVISSGHGLECGQHQQCGEVHGHLHHPPVQLQGLCPTLSGDLPLLLPRARITDLITRYSHNVSQNSPLHVQDHVNTAAYRPDTPDHSLLWLWAIHNVANTGLAGDPTEVKTCHHH